MNIRQGVAIAFAAMVVGCGGHHNTDADQISASDPNAVAQALLVKIGGGSTVPPTAGAPPPTSTAPEKPLAKVDGSDATVGSGGFVSLTLMLIAEQQALICKIFLKVAGSDSHFEKDLCGGAKLVQPGAPQQFLVSVQLPPNMSDGRFCLDASGQDNHGLVSNVAETCVNVSGDAGGGGTTNVPPVANAGQDRTVNPGQSVALSAAGSDDPDGSIVGYDWQQIGGAPVAIQGANTPTATFTAPAVATAMTFQLTVTDNSGDRATDSVTITNNGAVPPDVTLTIAPASITLGQSASLQWSSTNASACTASGDWSGARPTSGTQSVTPNSAGSYTFTITCAGATGTTPASDSVSLTVGAAPPQPTVTISVAPSMVGTGQNATLSWSSTNATACTASGAWSGTQTTSGSQSVSQSAAGTYPYTLTCSGAAGTTPATQSATLTVSAVPQPSVDLTVTPATVTPNQPATLQWTSSNATSCTASGSWTGARVTNGSQVVSQSNVGTYTYTLTCSGAAGTTPASDSAMLTVATAGPGSSVIQSLSDASEGANPYAGLVQASDGNLYGATCTHGASGDGSVFRITLAGAISVVHNFVNSTDGNCPKVDLIVGPGGALFGTTSLGGAGGCGGSGCGSVFRVALNGTFAVLHSFQDTDGNGPTGLTLASDGNFYGTTLTGGTVGGLGVVFRMTNQGLVTVLHTFMGGSTDGAEPWNLMQASDGNLYGVTRMGGPADAGVLYRITTAGAITTLMSFDGTNAGSPTGKLVEGSDGKLYGTAAHGLSIGGINDRGVLFRANKDGTGFEILHKFTDLGDDGDSPVAGMVFSGGNLYGTTVFGGLDGKGAVFRMAPDGSGYTMVYSFEGQAVVDGENPEAGLVVANDGNLYGTTRQGGAENVGVVYRIDPTAVGP